MAPEKLSNWINRCLMVSMVWALLVILLGAYTRLTDAGLGCPDWPGCYGQLWVSKALAGAASQKAWTEMIHRYVAGTLGLLIGLAAFLSFQEPRARGGQRVLPMVLVLLIMGQAALGMWTVTLRLWPVVVMGHLLGGLATISLLWLWWLLRHRPWMAPLPGRPRVVLGLTNAVLILLCLQVALGGWTSANYAALICPDFPTCQGHWLPPLSLQAFDFRLGFGLPNPLTAFGTIERMTIQVVHRLGALVLFLGISALSASIFCSARARGVRALAVLLWLGICVQVGLGISNVLYHLPVTVAVAHTGLAVFLLLLVLTLQVRLRRVSAS